MKYLRLPLVRGILMEKIEEKKHSNGDQTHTKIYSPQNAIVAPIDRLNKTKTIQLFAYFNR